MSLQARPAFGARKESLHASEYVKNKKNACQTKCFNMNMINKNYSTKNLNINLVTVLDLSSVCVIANNSTQTCSTPLIYDDLPNFYINYEIDPKGELFGNTSCGLNNYELFLKPNPPPPPYLSNK